MEKENVDNLFRETLDDFAQSPDPNVWDRIQVSLDQKAQRKRRAIPLWWQIGGAAAALALVLFLTLPGDESDSSVPANGEVTTTSSDTEQTGAETEDFNLSTGTLNEVTETNKAKTPAGVKTRSAILPSRDVAASESTSTIEEKSPSSAESGAEEIKPIANTDPVVAQLVSETDTGSQDPLTDAPLAVDPLSTDKETQGMAANQAPAVAEVQEEDATKEFRDLFEEIREEEIPQGNESDGKWAVGPSVAPVYYTASGTGSPIDNAFVNNDKAGNINMSYGVKVTYKLSDKWQLRSGLHKVDYTYDTNDIVFTSSLSTTANATMRNIDFASTSDYLVVESSSLAVTKAGTTGSDEIAAKNPARSGTMIQEMGYLEIPVEINYVLLDKKVGVNVVSGVSSLFLLDNVVNLESDNGTTEMGTANNINSLNFSANFGLGIDYEISKKVKLQLEPLIKYQLNTFSNTAGQFRPYSIGIYSGIQYKF